MNKPANYFPDVNPYQLAGPPTWFLKRLWEFDDSLAIVASKQGHFYRLTQKRPLKLPENIVNDILKEQADTRMMAKYGLVPITTILATVNWDNPLFFEKLRSMAPWRMGGAKKYEEMVLAQDRREAIAKNARQDEHLTHLAKDAWKFYGMKQGLRSSLFTHKTKSTNAVNKTAGLLLPNGKPYTPEVTTTWLDKV